MIKERKGVRKRLREREIERKKERKKESFHYHRSIVYHAKEERLVGTAKNNHVRAKNKRVASMYTK